MKGLNVHRIGLLPLTLLLGLLLSLPAQAQAQVQSLELAELQPLAQRVLLPLVGLFLLCQFVLAALRLILTYLLKSQIVAAAPAPAVVARLLPDAPDRRLGVVKTVALLLSTAGGLLACHWTRPLGVHSLVLLLVSTALGFGAYYFFLHQLKKQAPPSSPPPLQGWE